MHSPQKQKTKKTKKKKETERTHLRTNRFTHKSPKNRRPYLSRRGEVDRRTEEEDSVF